MIWNDAPLFKSLTPFGEALLRLIYPACCALCRQALTLEERMLCGICAEKLKSLELPRIESRKVFETGLIKEYFCLYAYKEELKDLWTQVKFNHRAWLIDTLRESLQKFLLAVQPETRYDYLIPVPVTFWRRLNRHYNQAELLAKQISLLSGMPVVRALKKVRLTPNQRQLSREERQSNLRNSLALREVPEQIRGSSVLLVDDIFTTGATARESARVLKRAGIKNIGIFTLAQTPIRIQTKL